MNLNLLFLLRCTLSVCIIQRNERKQNQSHFMFGFQQSVRMIRAISLSYLGKYVFHDMVGWNHTGKIKSSNYFPSDPEMMSNLTFCIPLTANQKPLCQNLFLQYYTSNVWEVVWGKKAAVIMGLCFKKKLAARPCCKWKA